MLMSNQMMIAANCWGKNLQKIASDHWLTWRFLGPLEIVPKLSPRSFTVPNTCFKVVEFDSPKSFIIYGL